MFTIAFYNLDKPYGCFSNFARCPIVVDGVTWPTSEHLFQAAKFFGADDRQNVRAARTPFAAAQIGRDRSRILRPDWEQVRDDAMRTALAAKFAQHAALRDILLSTGNCRLVEHTANDSYWGDGGDGSGANRLGHLLMELRDSDPERQAEFFAPPWLRFPKVEVSDLFWRMGAGEDYLSGSAAWRRRLSDAARAQYDAYFPVPEAWARSW